MADWRRDRDKNHAEVHCDQLKKGTSELPERLPQGPIYMIVNWDTDDRADTPAVIDPGILADLLEQAEIRECDEIFGVQKVDEDPGRYLGVGGEFRDGTYMPTIQADNWFFA